MYLQALPPVISWMLLKQCLGLMRRTLLSKSKILTIPLYPTDKATYLHTGVSQAFISSRKGSQYKNTAVYICNYAQAMAEQGKSITPCDVMCQQKAQVSSHVRLFHLGVCVVCYICRHRWWSTTEWGKHMTSKHSSLSPKDYYVKADFNPIGVVIKTEVTETASSK